MDIRLSTDKLKLIELVRERPEIYTHSHSSRSKGVMDTVKAGWTEIAEEMGLDVPECKKIWKGVRDRYVKGFSSKCFRDFSGGLLSFLNPFIVKKKTNTLNILPMNQEETQEGFILPDQNSETHFDKNIVTQDVVENLLAGKDNEVSFEVSSQYIEEYVKNKINLVFCTDQTANINLIENESNLGNSSDFNNYLENPESNLYIHDKIIVNEDSLINQGKYSISDEVILSSDDEMQADNQEELDFIANKRKNKKCYSQIPLKKIKSKFENNNIEETTNLITETDINEDVEKLHPGFERESKIFFLNMAERVLKLPLTAQEEIRENVLTLIRNAELSTKYSININT